MTWLLIVGLVVLAGATALVIRAILRGRRELERLRADQRTAVAYHARRARQIRRDIDAMGDEASHLFPPAGNGS